MIVNTSIVLFIILSSFSLSHTFLSTLPTILNFSLVHCPILVSSRSILVICYLHSFIFYSISSALFIGSSNLLANVFCILANIFLAFSLASCLYFKTLCTLSYFYLLFYNINCFSFCFSF